MEDSLHVLGHIECGAAVKRRLTMLRARDTQPKNAYSRYGLSIEEVDNGALKATARTFRL